MRVPPPRRAALDPTDSVRFWLTEIEDSPQSGSKEIRHEAEVGQVRKVLEVINRIVNRRPYRDCGCQDIDESEDTDEHKCSWTNDIRSDDTVGFKAIKS